MIAVLRRIRTDPALPLSRPEVRNLLDRLCQFLDVEMDLEVLITGDADSAALNRAFSGLPGPTNVLAFPADDDESPGQIALNADALSRECLLYGQAPAEHATRLLAHALLHLAGYDHGPEMYDLTEAAVDALQQKEDAQT